MSTILHVGSGQTYSTIQDAIAASGQGDTIIVHAGTYHEQVQIDGHTHDGLTIQAAPGNLVFIDPPATIAQTADSPTSGRDIYSLVTVNGADNVTISGLIVDGQQRGAEGEASGGTLAGITYVNADGGLIDHVVVTGIRDAEGSFGNQSGVGIYFLNSDLWPGDPNTPPVGASLNSIEIRDSTVQDFQKAAIVANYGDVDIHDNTIIGHGATTANSQDGIQVSHSTGSIDHNDVTDIGLVDPGYTSVSSGILAFEDRDLVIDDNNVVGTGATNASFGVVMQNSVGGAITDNHVSHVGWGVDVEGSPSFADPMVPGGTPGFTYDYSSNTISDVGFNSAYFAADPVSTDAFHVVGTDGNDVIRTGGGDDLIVGGIGDGNDVYDGGTGTDTVDYSSATSSVIVDLTATDRSGEAVSGGGTVGDLLTTAFYPADTPVGKATGSDIGTDALISIENVVGGHAADDITGDAADNVMVGGGGNDSLDGGDGIDTASYAASIAASAITIDAGSFIVAAGVAEGSDTLTNIERVHSAAANDILLVGNGGYASIQDAIDAAQDGDTIVVAAGTYAEHLVIDKDVTIVGPNHGVAGTDARGAEAIITGGIEITADGVTLDGVQVDGGGVTTTAVTDFPNGIFVNASHVTIENSVLTGGDTDARPLSTTGPVSDLDFSHNSVSHWGEGAYITDGGAGAIDHNGFHDNGNDIVTESVSMIISNNSFEDSVGSHIAAVPFDATVDVSSYIASSNTFSADHPRPISIYPNHTPGAQSITGSDFNETFKGTANAGDHGLSDGPFTFHAAGGNDLVFGGDFNDTLDGGAGDDALDGGLGIDTAHYAQTITTAEVAFTANHWVVTTGGAEGTDTLVNVEKIDHAGGHILLVGGGGYATIQAAVDAAQAGDTIMVGAGTFVGATIGKELTIIGSGSGQTIIDSTTSANGFNLTGDIDATSAGSATVTIEGFGFTDNNVGVRVASDINLDHLVIQNSDFSQNKANGVGMGSGAFGLSAIEISDSTFTQNGDGTFNGDGDISLFGFTGDALLKNLTITGGANAVPTNANADTAIQINGRDPGSYDVTHPIGNVVFDNVDIAGSYAKVLVYVQGFTNLSGLSFLDTGSSFTGHAGWGYAVNIDPTADETSAATPGIAGEPGFFDDTAAGALAPSSVDLSHVTISNDIPVNVSSGHPLFGVNGQALGAVFSGTPVSDHAIGSDAKEVMIGRAGDDDLDGRGGNDVFSGGAGNDRLRGGGGSDTAVYADPLDAGAFAYDFANSRWQVATTTEGTDQVSGIGLLTHGVAEHFFLVSGDSDFTTTNSTFASTVDGDMVVTALSVVEGSTFVDDFSSFGVFTSNLVDADSGLFHVDGAGHLVFNAARDFEAPADAGHDNVYRVQFQTTTGKTVTHVYDIRVTDAQFASIVDGNAGANQVSEAAANGAAVGITARASDGAGIVSGITYSLSNNANGAFAINAASGVVTVLDHTKLDFETQAHKTITVLASDGTPAHDVSQQFTINVLNALGHTVNGSGRADSINGTHGPTGPQAPSGFATNEEDTIRGKAGNDTIHGLGGNDRLFGDAGNDRLFGDAGNDRLDGGVGTDRLIGGIGIDRFVFKHGYGHDTVFGYTAGTDKIDLSGTGAHGFGGIHLVKNGANVDIHVGSDILTLDHTTIATINAHHGDFLFA